MRTLAETHLSISHKESFLLLASDLLEYSIVLCCFNTLSRCFVRLEMDSHIYVQIQVDLPKCQSTQLGARCLGICLLLNTWGLERERIFWGVVMIIVITKLIMIMLIYVIVIELAVGNIKLIFPMDKK